MNTLEKLVSLSVAAVDLVHDYLSLRFDDYTTLNVFNKYSYDDGDLSSLAGQTVISVNEGNQSLEIRFSKGGILSIGMTDDDFVGPEAMTLKLNSGDTVVWP